MKREAFGHGLPPDVKQRVRDIAAREGCSMSWLMEQVIITWFRLPMPTYIGPGKKTEVTRNAS